MKNSFEHFERIEWPAYEEKNSATIIDYETNLKLFLKSCDIWDIILVQRNSDWGKIWPWLLKITSSRYTHGMIVSSLNPVMITHATYKRADGTSGIEEIDLEGYMRQYEHMKIINCRIDRAYELAQIVKQEIFPKHKFHRFSAFFEAMIWYNFTSKHRWNCVEIISDALIRVLEDGDILWSSQPPRTALPEKLLYQLLTNVKRKSLYTISLEKE